MRNLVFSILLSLSTLAPVAAQATLTSAQASLQDKYWSALKEVNLAAKTAVSVLTSDMSQRMFYSESEACKQDMECVFKPNTTAFMMNADKIRISVSNFEKASTALKSVRNELIQAGVERDWEADVKKASHVFVLLETYSALQNGTFKWTFKKPESGGVTDLEI